MIQVAIGIQARSTSERFPGKINELINGKSMLGHVIEASTKAQNYLNNWSNRKVHVELAVLIPVGDPISERLKGYSVIEGPEQDVLTRYMSLLRLKTPDYVVRITGDCPLLPSFMISKAITYAVDYTYDYLSNVDGRCRTAPDGFDVECVSAKLLKHLDKVAVGADREHVTTLARRTPPPWQKSGCLINYVDLSGLKLSVDTMEDLERVRKEHEKVERALQTASRVFGKHAVHRV